ncbi:hypothetical protein [Mucilaginibacter psychrotolerans]|uniref:Uncharacterized protein n=1 Tax=Mucilaginibacter psychrotolerans TaxID=1524096 RepID=A0A4Y8S5R7_9SPHI|nr:hypothetical protein [Mucilaginibacter psychrotolerans]TFF33955.1 hypothetical protein E2R66_23530 [Mucilaginibacter psychrotolerans]
MDYTIYPCESLGNIALGLPRDQIRLLLKESYQEFYRNQFSKVPTDFYQGSGLFINYNESLFCEAIEIVQPAKPTLFSVKLLEVSYESVEEQIKEWDEKLEITKTGFTSYKFGIGAYAPDKYEFPNEVVESIIVFRKRYYDE